MYRFPRITTYRWKVGTETTLTFRRASWKDIRPLTVTEGRVTDSRTLADNEEAIPHRVPSSVS